MFGDVPMLNKEELLVYRGRVSLPSWTKTDDKEMLVISYCDSGNGIKIQSLDSVSDIFNGKKGEEVFNDFIISCIGTTQVMSQKRIGLGIDVCERLGITDSAYLVGFFDHLRLYPSKEIFESCFKGKVKERR